MASTCAHMGFHGIRSSYDKRRGVLTYWWTCEQCGQRLEEARSDEYRPTFDPQGNARFLAVAR